MIILVGNEKGGVGKTTLATNLAVAAQMDNKDVLLIDTDQQMSSTYWAKVREENIELKDITCVYRKGDVYNTLLDLKKRYDVIIVDAGGRDSIELRSAMTAADIMIVPLKAGQFDLWSFGHMHSLISQVKVINRNLKIFATLTMLPHLQSLSYEKDAEDFIKEYNDIIFENHRINERKVFGECARIGAGVLDIIIKDEHYKAKEQINLIWNFSKQLLNNKVEVKNEYTEQ